MLHNIKMSYINDDQGDFMLNITLSPKLNRFRSVFTVDKRKTTDERIWRRGGRLVTTSAFAILASENYVWLVSIKAGKFKNKVLLKVSWNFGKSSTTKLAFSSSLSHRHTSMECRLFQKYFFVIYKTLLEIYKTYYFLNITSWFMYITCGKI